MRSYGRKEEDSTMRHRAVRFPSLKDAFLALHTARLAEKRPLGKILGDAVTSSVQTLLMVGGFIILFSVFNRLLSVVQLTDILSIFTKAVLSLFQLPAQLDIPLCQVCLKSLSAASLSVNPMRRFYKKQSSSALFSDSAVFRYRHRWRVFCQTRISGLNHFSLRVFYRAFMRLYLLSFYGSLSIPL